MMKFSLILISLTLATVANAQKSEPIDYTQIKPEHFKNLQDRQTFVDEHSNETYRIVNRDYKKGLEIQFIKNGKPRFAKHGVFYSFYNGYKTGMTTYHYGKRHGLKETYTKNGVVQFKGNYKEDKKDGLFEQRNDKDKLVNKASYVAGLKHGVEYSYYNEKVDFKKDWVNGKRHGDVLQYNYKGEVVAKTVYVDGKKVGKTIWY